ncbi:MAG: hypothetical protein MN733_05175, partial [Nitrososphaera sp.]|nr:hypothetical protein [Nitrososphaera sp.]
SQMSVDPAIEDQLMQLGHYVPVHPMDDIEQHMRVHRQSLETDGDPFQTKAVHIQEHEMAFMQQQAAQQAAITGPAGPEAGQQGGPGGPVPGAQPQAPTGAQRPPGAIHPDVISDPSLMPRGAYQ